ncbi:flavin reductase family protein [Jiella mangrovi]|uniref:Flavin reductase family protein n=1 Tax=Jiella mangrovi TaxID=2821407 RepID=A0ABS4BNN1_9HYPH|nr:flavin reductase family protein [Jiella mangrovi]MBP0617735.1 flavin reductase family protein [Jiella mangrovi]
MTIAVELPQDPATLRNAFASFPTGVTALCAMIDDTPVGMAAASFTPVSLEPPLVSVCIQNTSSTWPKFSGAARIGVSVLSDCHDRAVKSLSAKEGDRFAGVAWTKGEGGSIFIDGAAAQFDCSVHAVVDAGDHQIVLMHIHTLGVRPEIEPLVFHGSRLRKLVPS